MPSFIIFHPIHSIAVKFPNRAVKAYGEKTTIPLPHRAARRSAALHHCNAAPLPEPCCVRAPLPSRSGPPLPLPLRAAIAELLRTAVAAALLRPAVAELRAPGPARRGRCERRVAGRGGSPAAASTPPPWPPRANPAGGAEQLAGHRRAGGPPPPRHGLREREEGGRRWGRDGPPPPRHGRGRDGRTELRRRGAGAGAGPCVRGRRGRDDRPPARTELLLLAAAGHGPLHPFAHPLLKPRRSSPARRWRPQRSRAPA